MVTVVASKVVLLVIATVSCSYCHVINPLVNGFNGFVGCYTKHGIHPFLQHTALDFKF